MKVELFSYSDLGGGAARATYRIHRALLAKGTDSSMQVAYKFSDDFTVHGPVTRMEKFSTMARIFLSKQVIRIQKTSNTSGHSMQYLPATLSAKLKNSTADVLNLHWVGSETLSIGDIGRIRKPTVWTLHDMWGFCGSEHVSWDKRYRDGYTSKSRPVNESGFDLNKWIWNKKRSKWLKPIQIITPSTWLAERAKESVIMRDWPIKVIPNPLDTLRWRPIEQKLARELLQLPSSSRILTFGAIGGSLSYHKGFDLLLEAFRHLRGQVEDLHLVVFGQSKPINIPDLGFPIQYLGYLNDDISLQLLYSASDLVVVPSRCDAFGQVASEAHACGTPVVAFDSTGLADIVIHKETGYLAKAFDTEDFAKGILWVLNETLQNNNLGDNARKSAVSRFSNEIVAEQYIKVYRSL